MNCGEPPDYGSPTPSLAQGGLSASNLTRGPVRAGAAFHPQQAAPGEQVTLFTSLDCPPSVKCKTCIKIKEKALPQRGKNSLQTVLRKGKRKPFFLGRQKIGRSWSPQICQQEKFSTNQWYRNTHVLQLLPGAAQKADQIAEN